MRHKPVNTLTGGRGSDARPQVLGDVEEKGALHSGIERGTCGSPAARGVLVKA
jgi:hypothetical protein